MPHAYIQLDPPSTPSSTDSSDSLNLLEHANGSHRVKYRGAGPLSPHDFILETGRQNVDVSLVLPHFRARNQPLDHRLSMLVANGGLDPIKVKVCRNFTTARSTRFHLEVYAASSADITVWLPSDFKGHIHRSAHSKRVRFSAGFTNRIMHNVQLTQSRRPSLVTAGAGPDEPYSDIYISHPEPGYAEDKWYGGVVEEDEVVVHTAGHVTFRMWDIDRGEPEVRAREACKRMFGFGWCAKRTPEVAIDWDFLIEDQ
ncbi:hypothetical protein PsYK624_040160 [Phanerochaete sordida]|uniref:DUF7330 domain-containing protein n=1 Tax=Phanerochaete sordida TaxID=48140 RepID=A0A9P3G2P3_9APHY|nr:hypothetical protein PsYK624_040160 [Phanerochaete sordida]